MQLTITKLTHSCLLVESDGATALFDPGSYSHTPAAVFMEKTTRLDYIFVTHEHADHCYVPFIEELAAKFPQTKLVSTREVIGQLQGKVGLQLQSEQGDNYKLFAAPHENLPTGSPPSNTGIHFLDLLSHPGDSHSFSETKRVLAMPMTAPWGSMTNAVKKIIELKPEVVIPIHDWHWKPEALQGMYERLQAQLELEHIKFLIPIDGHPIELQLP